MNKEFVTYEKALALKELGFDEPCLSGYQLQTATLFSDIPHTLNGNIHKNSEGSFTCAPLYQQAFRWFREKYDLRIWIESNRGVLFYEYIIATTNPYFINKQFTNNEVFNSYEEAESACLNKLIEIVKNGK